jgi:hypothetical protein
MRVNHFPTHTVEGAKALNECGKYLLVGILRMETDCTNGGVTSPAWEGTRYFVPCLSGNFNAEDVIKHPRSIVFEVVPPAFEGCAYRLKVKGESRWGMAGGNWAHTSDSRFSETYGAPLSVHDRHE